MDCPSLDQLRSFLGDASTVLDSEFAQHLETCAQCRDSCELLCTEEFGSYIRNARMAPAGLPLPMQLVGFMENLVHQQAIPSSLTHQLHKPTNLSVGQEIGPYRIERLLGRGGMGIVFLATQTLLKRHVALKVIDWERPQSTDAIARFTREMSAIGQFRHPNVVQAYDAGVIDGSYYLAMEYVDGMNLEEHAGNEPTQNLSECCKIIHQAALGLAFIHKLGFVHRDVKPSNVLMNRDGLVKLSDLGLVSRTDPDDVALTSCNKVLGTADYMSPEQVAGYVVDGRSDIYSLGCVLYRLLVGAPPFSGPQYRNLASKFSAHLHDVPRSVWHYRQDVSSELQQLLDYLLEKDPSSRLHSAHELVERIESLPEWQSVLGPALTRNVHPPSRSVMPIWSRSARRLAAVVLGAGICASLIFFRRLYGMSPNLKRFASCVPRFHDFPKRHREIRGSRFSNPRQNLSGFLWAPEWPNQSMIQNVWNCLRCSRTWGC